MKASLYRSLAAGVVLVTSAPVLAQYAGGYDDRYYEDGRGWETIGRKAVNGQIDDDRVEVRGSERFRKLRLCSVNNAFELRRMVAHYANGSSQRFDVGMTVPDGRCTRAFDLNGRRRNIDYINLTYSRTGWGARRPQLIVQAR